MGLLLHDNRASGYRAALVNIAHLQPYKVTTSQLAINGEVEQRQMQR
jgi:hypothetical protein